MSDSPAPDSSARKAAVALAHLPALLAPALCRPFSVGGLVFVVVVAIGFRLVMKGGWARAVGGALASTFAGFVWIFAKGSGAPMVLVLPAIVVVLAAVVSRAAPRVGDGLREAPLSAAVVLVLATLGLQRSLAPDVGIPPLTDDFFYALRANPVPESLSDSDRAAAMALVDAVVNGTPAPTELSSRLNSVPEGPVYVTLFRRARRGGWTRGSSDSGTLSARIESAAKEAWRRAPRRSAWASSKDDVRVVIDIAGPEQRLGARPLRELAQAVYKPFAPSWARWRFLVYDAEPGVDGFRVVRGDDEGVVLPADNTFFGWTTPRSRKRRYRHHNLLNLERHLAKRAGFEGRDGWPNGATLYNFRSYSFARPDPADPSRTVELYRGNVLRPDLPSEAELVDAIHRAGRWLLGTVEPDGRFDYEYFPNRDDHGKGYNEVRHAGSVYGLFHMVHLARAEPSLRAGSDDYLAAGLTALDRVYRNLGSPPGVAPSEGYIAFLEGDEGAKTNSGAASLTLLSFLERPTQEDTEDPELAGAIVREEDDVIMAGLVKTLLRMIDDRGWVYAKWSDARDRALMEREPLYYPGEAMLALARYHEQVGSPEALEGAKAIGRRQAALLDRFWSIPDHWVMQAMDALDRLDPENPLWREAGYEMARRFMLDQSSDEAGGLRNRAPFPDYRGAFRRVQEVPRTTRAAARGEAVGGIARIAWRRGEDATVMEQSLIEGARHLMEQMYTPDNSFFFPDPEEGLGAIRMGIIDNHIRIDNNQHGVVALGNALEALRRREARQ